MNSVLRRDRAFPGTDTNQVPRRDLEVGEGVVPSEAGRRRVGMASRIAARVRPTVTPHFVEPMS